MSKPVCCKKYENYFTIYCLLILLQVVEEGERETEKKQKVEKKSNRGFWFWKSKKVGPDPEFLEKVAERKEHADFWEEFDSSEKRDYDLTRKMKEMSSTKK